MLVKRNSDFLAPGFLTGVGFMGDTGLLSVNLSGVETIAASIIYLNYCWLSHLPVCLYNLLIFWRKICSNIALLLKDWSIRIVFTWFLRLGDCNMTLTTTHCCSNVSIRENRINHLCHYPWFIKLGCLGNFTIIPKINVLFIHWR